MRKPHPETAGLVTVAYFARRLDKHPETVRRWIRAKLIPSFLMPSGQHMIPSAALAKILSTSDHT